MTLLKRVTLRLRVEDLEEAKRRAADEGIPYHVLIRELVRDGLGTKKPAVRVR